jgi:hypothetical protein
MNGEGGGVDIELLKQAGAILSKCGRPIRPRGVSAVPLFKCFLMPMTIGPGDTQTFIKEVTGDTTWTLRAISSTAGSNANTATNVRIQIQLPNGRYLFGGKNGIDSGQFASTGSFRYLQDPPMDCNPGDKIRVTLSSTNNAAPVTAITLLFEGHYQYYMTGGPSNDPALASELPRYQGIVNENILAPPYIAGLGPETPAGYDDEFFTYSSDTLSVAIGGANRTGTVKINIDNGLDFLCRRILPEVTASNTATAGAFLGRVRVSSGYALCDSFMDLERYIGGSEWPGAFPIKGGDEVFIDLNLVDTAGTGSVSITVHMEGVRRRKL